MEKNYKTDTIPLEMLPAAEAQGWEVYAYSEYVNGVPKYAEIRIEAKKMAFQILAD